MSLNVKDHSSNGTVEIDRLAWSISALLQAHDYAHDLGLCEWSFAVEIAELRAAHLSNNDLRWLVCKGYVKHAREHTPIGEDVRAFREAGRLRFCRRTCFVLTPAGAAFCQAARVRGPAEDPAVAVCTAGRPRWDADRQELRFGSDLVKQYKVPAPNQEMILAAFEEEGWPQRIDDPIPPAGDSDPKRRLHDTIVSLNRKQKRRRIRFLGDGSGEGVRWEALAEPDVSHPTHPPAASFRGTNGRGQAPASLPAR
jgi:hypothetical protein